MYHSGTEDCCMPDQEREKYLKEISSLHAENATLKEEMA
jgi:hypothetical protein